MKINKLYNIDAEQNILGGIMNHNDSFYKLLDLKQTDFYEPLHQLIYEKMAILYQKGSELNPVTLHSYLTQYPVYEEVGGQTYLLRMTGLAGGLINLRTYADLISELKTRRDLTEYITKYSNEGITMETDLTTLFSEMEVMLHKPSDKIRIRKESQVAVDIAITLAQELPCFSTGYSKLDELMAGGLYKSKSYGLVGRDKTGKTTTLGSISHHLSQAGVKHMYVAVEMGANEIYQRTMAYVLKRNPIVFYDKEKRENSEFQMSVTRMARSTEGCAIFADAPGITFEELQRLIITMVKKHNLDGVIIDYLQIIGGMPAKENEAQFLGKIAQWIADMGREYNIFTLSGAQENADGTARGSKGIQQAFDMMLYMHRPDDETKKDRWFRVGSSRYTLPLQKGSELNPSFKIGHGGVFLEQLEDAEQLKPRRKIADYDSKQEKML